MIEDKLHIGTCSWKYDSWQGIIYPRKKPFNYLQEYSRHYRTVEVDQWFWSLFGDDKVVLPKPFVVEEYARSTPEDFTFCIKVPNSVTLTHHYKKKKTDPLVANPHFLSIDLMERFLERLTPLSANIGPLIFQFEYLNRQKMGGGLAQFMEQFGDFARNLPSGYHYCLELRNPNFLGRDYFDFLNTQGLSHVFLHGYYMPSIFDVYRKHCRQVRELTLLRLHGPDRKRMEALTGKDWSRIATPRDRDIHSLVTMLRELQTREVMPFVLVNNHFEGCAPRTIVRIKEQLAAAPQQGGRSQGGGPHHR